jgi:hypothetical protein
MARTARQLCEGALRQIGVAGQGVALSSEALNDTFFWLQSMLDEWAGVGLKIHQVVTITHVLTAGTREYTIGPSGQDITADPIPTQFISAALRDAEEREAPVNFINVQEWRRIEYKPHVGQSDRLYYDRGAVNGTIYLYPTPELTWRLVLDTEGQLVEPANLSADTVVPTEFHMAIMLNLALLIAPIYGRSHVLTADFHRRAAWALDTVRARSNKRRILRIDPAIVGIDKPGLAAGVAGDEIPEDDGVGGAGTMDITEPDTDFLLGLLEMDGPA